MNKERTLQEAKNYLISVHDTLRRGFRNAPPEEQVFITNILEGLEKDVNQIEALEEMMEVWKIGKKHKNLESIIEE